MNKEEVRKRISKIIDQLSKGETTSHLVEEIQKKLSKTSKNSSDKPKNT